MNIQKTDIAIIGISCHFPQSKNVNEFWENLQNGVDCIHTFSKEELIQQGISEDLLNHPNYVRRWGMIENIDKFDAAFFKISPAEAKNMDPQHRLFLENSWRALESAAYNPYSPKHLIGIFASCGFGQYAINNIGKNKTVIENFSLYDLVVLNEKDALATKVAYKLNLRGPAITIQTACSSSLVAVHYACQSLLNGECDIALAGAASFSVQSKQGYLYQEGMILSKDGYCRSFDEDATGTVPGSGVGVVVLKIAEDAIEDGDFIYAVIKGSAINNDGSNKVSYTSPSVDGQKAVILEAWENAGINGREISYIETHGTGTKLGDPIEIGALTEAMHEHTQDKHFCAIGSAKTNIGHADAAAGCAGLIKTALALYHKQIPPSLHYKKGNPNIDFEQSPFFVNTKLVDWSEKEIPRKAGVSSFGIGGTNAHIVLEEVSIPKIENPIDHRWHVMVFSAYNKESLNLSLKQIQSFVVESGHESIANVAYTLQIKHQNFPERLVLLCHNKEDIISEKYKIKEKIKIETNAHDISVEINFFLEKNQNLMAVKNYKKLYALLISLLREKKIDNIIEQEFSEDSEFSYLSLLAKLWLSQINIDWSLIHTQNYQKILLPTYPFQRKSYWIFPDQEKAPTEKKDNTTPVKMDNNTEKILIEIWQNFLGVEKISTTDDFFVLGGDSLLAVSMIEKINTLLHCDLTPESLLNYPNIAMLTNRISRPETTKQLPFSLVELQKGNGQKPLFLIHPVGGTVYFYRDLVSAFDSEQTVYGIQDQSLDGKTPPHKSIGEMAEHYISIIKSMQINDSFFLGGSSFGGLVAYEMAQQLLQQNEKLPYLFLIDTPTPNEFPADITNNQDFIRYFVNMYKENLPLDILNMEEEQQMHYLAKKMDISIDQLNILWSILHRNMNMGRQYSQKSLSIDAVFFSASLQNEYFPHPLENNWKIFIKGNMDIIKIEGNHITMNELLGAKKIGKIIQLYIND